MQDHYDTIKELGGELVVFSPETHETTAGLAKKLKLTFPIVRDEEQSIARSFGLVFDVPEAVSSIYAGFGIDIPKFTGRDVWQLPMPARYVIDKAGIIQAADVDPDYTSRPEPDDTMAVVRGLA